MPLLSLWASNPQAILQLNIEQVVANAGDGKLKDESTCSHELRTFLTQVPGERLSEYAEHCLSNSFPKSGIVLQDIVNELGRRLDYQVENGRYQGVVGSIGFDGIWSSPESNDIVVEVKTTDAYRIALDTVATYRSKLQAAGKLKGHASILIVVGREDTGELEAQVRGSRHAWDMRLISIDALITLVKLKESTEAGVTGSKLRSVLIPMEFTRLDALVDVMFTTAKDVETTAGTEKPLPPGSDGTVESKTTGWQFTDQELLRGKHDEILMALGRRDDKKLIKRSMALYWDATHAYRVACTISKRYTKKGAPPYWYAYHPTWNVFLGDGEVGKLVLGCMDLRVAFALPLATVKRHLGDFNTTGKEDGSIYWHLNILEPEPGIYTLHLPKSASQLPLNEFILPLL
ncbi:MAG: hypothetical protein JO250_24395 [Armatimonadetes bacterium]|nr:hypothetical protein [Armatimonadota bacterium]